MLYSFATTKKWYFYNEEANTCNEFCDNINEFWYAADIAVGALWIYYPLQFVCIKYMLVPQSERFLFG
ncbi:hypothetical protein OROGR_017191 [Orobanche gracilis]